MLAIDPAPRGFGYALSEQDLDLTNRIKEALSLIDIRLLDHLIIG